MTDMLDKQSTVPEQKGPARKSGWRWRARLRMPVRAHRNQKPARTLTATLRDWHKRAGLGAFLFVGWLGISGVALNQSASWGLDALRIDWPWLMAAYGLHAESPQSGFVTDGHWLAAMGSHAVLDGRPLSVTVQSPVGFEMGGDREHRRLFVASYGSVLLLNTDGTRIDELQASLTLPVKSVQRIGSVAGAEGMVVIEDQVLYGSSDGETWKKLAPDTIVRWSLPVALTDGQRRQFEQLALPSVAAEQILIDLHSGRLFGRYGRYVVNAVGTACLWLAISGVWMTWRTSQARRKNTARR